ncbi:MAG: hypothetical protein NXI20_06305 [bacterium]|nr:hypothetical protein [bacterium]
MELKIIPHSNNLYSTAGFLIKGGSPFHWVSEIQRLEISLNDIICFAIPGRGVNSVWGCLVAFKGEYKPLQNNPHLVIQLMDGKIYLPSRSILYPRITPEELNALFPGDYRYLVHPDVGIVPLESRLNWSDLVSLSESDFEFKKPNNGVFIPTELKRIQVKPQSPEETLRELDQQVSSGKGIPEGKPLSMLEKVKLAVFKRLQNKKAKTEVNSPISPAKSNWFDRLLGKIQNNISQQVDNLEERNKKSLDKLMELFKKDAEEALKYAIPLNEGEAFRGSSDGLMDYFKRWTDFSLFGNSGTSNTPTSGAVTMPTDHYSTLYNQYIQTARQLEKEGDFKKAAFIYLKLLKQPQNAAKLLEQGKYFQEAASIYLQNLKDKSSAARCYENGKMTERAIDLYKEMKNFEKVGDLYKEINKPVEANEFYELVVDNYEKVHNYQRAGNIIKEKMGDLPRYQNLMKKGWINKVQENKCLDNLIQSIEEPTIINSEIEDIYLNHTNNQNIEDFIKVIVKEYQRNRGVNKYIKEISYEIISEYANQKPNLPNILQILNSKDTMLSRDITRFRNGSTN